MNLLNLAIWAGLDFDFANWASGVFKNFGFLLNVGSGCTSIAR